MPSIDCRLAKLEATIEHMEVNFNTHCEKEYFQQSEMMKILQELRDKQQKMSGFWAGIVFVISAIASGLTIFFSRGGM